MHRKRVLSKSPTRSRSPSPKVHKLAAEAVLKSRQKQVIRAVIYDDKTMKILVYKKWFEEEKLGEYVPTVDYS